MKLNTVTGQIDIEQMGTTLMHEHTCTSCDLAMRKAFGDRFFEPDVMVEVAGKQLKRAKSFGIDTIIDATPANLNRDIHLIKKSAEYAGINIIVSGGFYYPVDPGTGPMYYRSEDEVYELLRSECVDGIEDTDIKPGMMKGSVDDAGFTDYVIKILNAIARVAAEFDLPVFCHHKAKLEQGNQLLDIFEKQGVPMHRIIVGHCGETADVDYLESLLKRGCYVGLDRFGLEYTPETMLDSQLKLLAELCNRGWTRKIFLSHDHTPYLGMFGKWEDTKNADNENLDVDFTYIHRKALPLFPEYGLYDADIEQLLVKNPVNFFAGTK